MRVSVCEQAPGGLVPEVELSGTGEFDCLIGDETVTVRLETGSRRMTPLSLLFAEQSAQYRTRCFQAGGNTDVIYKPILYALTVDTERFCPAWKPVRYLFRRPFAGTLIQVVTEDSRQVTVTHRHPMLVFEDAQFVIRPAEELRHGDCLPVYWQEAVATIPVKEIFVHQAETTVYSMEVDETHIFATSFGLYVHNCIPFSRRSS